MDKNNPSTEETLRKELGALGAREFEVVALTMESERGLAALRHAVEKGANYPISYAIKLFDSDEWMPQGEKRRLVTNAHVDRRCSVCDGDGFVPVTDSVTALYGETYAPCANCNAQTNTAFFRVNGDLVRTVPR
jgi:hypothetical protein